MPCNSPARCSIASRSIFSFSGLKTAVLYHVARPQGPRGAGPESLSPQGLRECRRQFFRAACIDVLRKKLERGRAAEQARKSVVVGGGVSANRGLRKSLASFPGPGPLPRPMRLLQPTNAAMIAGVGRAAFPRRSIQSARTGCDSVQSIREGRNHAKISFRLSFHFAPGEHTSFFHTSFRDTVGISRKWLKTAFSRKLCATPETP